MEGLFTDIMVILSLTVPAVLVARRLGLPEILGYLTAGLLLGPKFTGAMGKLDALHFMAELGVILLMFSVGLEFSPRVLWALRRHVFVTGGCEVLLVGGCAGAAALVLGLAPTAAVLVGAAVAMSSTAITLKQLRELDSLHAQPGRLAVGVLLFQDLATLPFLILAKAGTGADEAVVAWQALLKVGIAAAFAGTLLLLRPALRRGLAWVEMHATGEPFLLTALLCVLGTSFAAQMLGLSAAVGAFFAGMAISQSDVRHRFEEDIRPFRDVFLGIFFVTVGLQLDLGALLMAPRWVALWLVMLLPVKGLIILVISRLMREPMRVGLPASIMLAHGGEFGLLLLTVGISSGSLDPRAAQPLLAAVGLSMALAPFLIRISGSRRSGLR